MQTINITDYKLLSPTLAKVIISWTGDMKREAMASTLAASMKYLATPVEGSFRKIGKTLAVGFVRANREVRTLEANTKDAKTGQILARTRYKVMSSNILMDNEDRSLWEVKSGPGGTQFLARHGNEDLSELIESATNHRSDIPSLRRITMAKAAKGELAAFCTKDGYMDYGTVLRTGEGRCEVLSKASLSRVVVDNELIASLAPISIRKDVHKQVMARVMTEQERATAADYWRTLFSIAPEFADQMVHYTESDAVL